MNKELNKLLKKVKKQGLPIEGGNNGHLKVYSNDRKKMVVISHSPKSSSTKKVVNDLKKIGFVPN